MLGIVEVQFTCELETVRTIADQVFVMAESATYFEAYKHNLTALQLIENMSFSQYIVDCKDNIKPPAYLRTDEEKPYDLTILDSEYVDEITSLEEDRIENKHVETRERISVSKRKRDKTLESVDILNDRSWPDTAKLGLDESQHKTLKNALTHEFSVTQGPPGTGKTFIGLKVARALLTNKAVWSAGENKQALLVVCYTNHALDQFLCGIHSFFTGEIIRIGGRSANEEMQQHGIKTMYKYITSDVREASDVARASAVRTEERINELKEQIYRLDREIVKTDQLTQYMDKFREPLQTVFEQKIKQRNHNNSNSSAETLDLIHEWLGCGVLRSRPDIIVHFEHNELERKPLVQKAGKTNDKHHAANETTSRYYEETGCISKCIVKSSIETGSDKKRFAIDVPNSVAYKDIVPMNEKSKEKIRKIWQIRFSERWELYKSWTEELKHDLIEKLKEYEENYLQCCQDIKHSTRDKHIQALKQADVIGMTTTGAAKHYEILQSIKPKIVIVEEAAEVLEGHIITSLSDECQHLILIGDHKQLKPSPTVYQLAKKYKLDLSLFERMVNNKVRYESLEFQHRMRPEIANIIRLFYPNLKDHELVLNKPNIRGVSRNVYFITHQHPEEEDEDSTSHLNEHEAQFLVGLCRYLLKQEYKPSQITVLTTYKAQMFYLHKLMPKESEFGGVKITVVDNYQGEENEIVLLSLVRSNASKKVGFLKTENRINVALSRARNELYVIGNLEHFAGASDTWARIVSLLQKEDQIGPAIPLFCRNHADKKLCAQTMKDFENAPEGGCSVNCDARLDCGHVCELKCHVYDTDHKEYKCTKQCIRICQNGHHCFKQCFEACGDCQVQVVKVMPECGHEQTMQCFQDPLEWGCDALCDKMCEINHPCLKWCYEDCGDCPVEMVKTLPQCGHKHVMPCFMDESSWKCKEDCERKCKNDHECSKMCFEDCTQCDVIFQRTVSRCGHDQLIPCFMEESQWKCNAYCEKKCKNNHRCKKLCSDDCGNCTAEMTKEMIDCGHFQPVPCYIEPCDWKCTVPCDEVLECGHKSQCLCSDIVHNICRIEIQIKLDTCGHTADIECLRRNEKILCHKDCVFILDCGHKCTRKCYQPHVTICLERVSVQLENCGHSAETICYRSKRMVTCVKPCDHILECGHKCVRRCSEPHTTMCLESVLKEKKCGHSHRVPCYKDVETVVCMKPCELALECGHQCRKRCSESHTTCCTEEVEKILPCCQRKLSVRCMEDIKTVECPFPCQEKLECGHSCTNECSKPHTSFCKVVIGKTLPCEHVKDLYCGVKVDSIKCTRHCKTVLPCGHGCKNTCAEPHTPDCEEKVNYECNYGHKTTAPCHKIHTRTGTECHFKCRQKLACGHVCSGSCFT